MTFENLPQRIPTPKRARLLRLLFLVLIYMFVSSLAMFTGIRPWPVAALFATILIWITDVDFERFEIPDTGVILLVVAGVWYIQAFHPWQLGEALVSGLLWPVVFLLVAFAFRKIRGYQGLGLGDVKLMAGIGVWLGVNGTLWVVLTASISGMFFILAVGLFNHHQTSLYRPIGVAFGPFLCICAWGIWLYGDVF